MSIGNTGNTPTEGTVVLAAVGACAPVGAASLHPAPPGGVQAGDPRPVGPRPAPVPTLLHIDIAVGLAGAPALWRPHTGRGGERRATRVLATPSYEAWVVQGPDHTVAVHDHGDAAAVVVVVEGEVAVLDARGRTRRTLGVGEVAHLPAGVAHDLVLATDATTTIQVLSPPPVAVGVYEEGSGELVAVGEVDPGPAVHDAASVARVLQDVKRRPAGAPRAPVRGWSPPRGL